MGKFTHFGEKTNILYERARFNQRRQDTNENVDDFIADLFRLVETCNFGDLREELIRDRIVVGVRNTKLSEAMQLQADLTLEKAVTKARQADEVKRHQGVIRGIDNAMKNESEVDYIYRKGGNRQNKIESRQQYKEKTSENTMVKKCSRKLARIQRSRNAVETHTTACICSLSSKTISVQ